jgi:hypothetical protein
LDRILRDEIAQGNSLQLQGGHDPPPLGTNLCIGFFPNALFQFGEVFINEKKLAAAANNRQSTNW